MSPIHPNLLEEIYYDKFLPILFKCWIWLKQVVCYNSLLRDRHAPPYRKGFVDDESLEPLFDPMDCQFRFPWCQDRHLQRKSIFYVDYLYYETFCNPFIKVVDAGRDFPSVKVEVWNPATKYGDLREHVWGFLTEVPRPDGEVFEQYYWDSFWIDNQKLLCGPISLCDHYEHSPFKFTDRVAGPGSKVFKVGIPAYQGRDYILDREAARVSVSKEMWTIPEQKGVLLWTNSHSINERLHAGYELKIQYQGNRSIPEFVHPHDRKVCDWEDPRYYNDLTCMSPDIYKYK